MSGNPITDSVPFKADGFLVFVGSWDATLRIWDTRDGSCLVCLLDHQADVYGITSHPERPFLVVTSSRDTTIRLWNTTHLFPDLLVYQLGLCKTERIAKHMMWEIKSDTFEKVCCATEKLICKLDRLTQISNYLMMPGAD